MENSVEECAMGIILFLGLIVLLVIVTVVITVTASVAGTVAAVADEDSLEE